MRDLAGRPNWIAVINIEHLTTAIKEIHDRFLTCSIRTAADVLREQKRKACKMKTLKFNQTSEELLAPHPGTSSPFFETVRKVFARLTPRQEKLLRMSYGIGESAKSIENAAFEWRLTLEEVEKEYTKAMKVLKSIDNATYLFLSKQSSKT